MRISDGSTRQISGKSFSRRLRISAKQGLRSNPLRVVTVRPAARPPANAGESPGAAAGRRRGNRVADRRRPRAQVLPTVLAKPARAVVRPAAWPPRADPGVPVGTTASGHRGDGCRVFSRSPALGRTTPGVCRRGGGWSSATRGRKFGEGLKSRTNRDALMRCADKSTVSQWRGAIEVMEAVESFDIKTARTSPSHAYTIARHAPREAHGHYLPQPRPLWHKGRDDALDSWRHRRIPTWLHSPARPPAPEQPHAVAAAPRDRATAARVRRRPAPSTCRRAPAARAAASCCVFEVRRRAAARP